MDALEVELGQDREHEVVVPGQSREVVDQDHLEPAGPRRREEVGQRLTVAPGSRLRLIRVHILVRDLEAALLGEPPAGGDLVLDALGALVIRAVPGVDGGAHGLSRSAAGGLAVSPSLVRCRGLHQPHVLPSQLSCEMVQQESPRGVPQIWCAVFDGRGEHLCGEAHRLDPGGGRRMIVTVYHVRRGPPMGSCAEWQVPCEVGDADLQGGVAPMRAGVRARVMRTDWLWMPPRPVQRLQWSRGLSPDLG